MSKLMADKQGIETTADGHTPRRWEHWYAADVLPNMHIKLKLVGSPHHAVDEQVQEVPDVLVAAERATKAARYIIAADVLAGIPVDFDGRVDVIDHGGKHISSIRFADVLAAKAA